MITVVAIFTWEHQRGKNRATHDVVNSVFTAGYLIASLLMVIFTVRVTKSDPTDPTVALERFARLANEQKMAAVEFDVCEYEFFCEVCDTHVLKNTKHCQRCNRCSAEFDHHCVWVANDIGLSNYIDFIRMLTGVFFTVIF